ncbi:MAG: serine protease [Bacteroidota bacterium]
MKYQILKIGTFAFLFGTICSICVAQDSLKPYSFSNECSCVKDIPLYSLESFNLEQALLEDEEWRSEGHETFRFAKPINVDIDIKEDGLMEVLPGNTRIWRLALESKGAFTLSAKFDSFDFTPNTRLFIYNQDKSDIIALKEDKKHKFRDELITRSIEGDQIIIEINEPFDIENESKFNISHINHSYKDLATYTFPCPDWGYGEATYCIEDINCSDGDDWQVEKDAVLLMVIDSCTVCTGILLNNTDQDGTPYVLTADHCYADYESRYGVSYSTAVSNTVFYFNYESPTCDGIDGSKSQYISGASLKANWADTDFCLLELSSTPSASFNPYYAGWYNLNVAATSAATIHHPGGDVKKISLSNPDSSAVSMDYNVQEEVSWGDHWAVYWDNSMTEGGSSGAALFNQNHRVVGQVHGGHSNCQNWNLLPNGEYEQGPHRPTYFGKLYYSWDGDDTITTRLKDWLNPEDDTNELAGLRLIEDFTITSSTSTSGDIVIFNDVSVQSGTDVVVDITESFKATGTLSIPTGCTLEINP